MLISFMALALAFNLIIIKYKLESNRVPDAILDISSLVALAWVFSGSTQSLMVATIASAIISIYLLVFPPKFSRQRRTL